MELIKRVERAIVGTDMREVRSYYDGSFGGVRFEKVGETGEAGVYEDVEFTGYLVSEGFDVVEFSVHICVREENPEIVQIFMGKDIDVVDLALVGSEDTEIGVPVLGSFIFGDGGDFSMFYTWPMAGEVEFLKVLKTMAEEFGTEIVWMESEWAD